MRRSGLIIGVPLFLFLIVLVHSWAGDWDYDPAMMEGMPLPKSTPIQVSILSNATADGHIDGSGNAMTLLTYIDVGDGADNTTWEGYLSFDILANLPAGVSIVSALLMINQYAISDNPYATLGPIEVSSLDYGTTLESSDDNISGELIGVLAPATTTYEWKSLGVTQKVKENYENTQPRVQFRLSHQFLTDSDSTADHSTFYSADNGSLRPQLVVNYIDGMEVTEIGDGNYTDKHIPMESDDNYTYSQTLYFSEDIGTLSAPISSISYNYNGNSVWTQQVDIYMGHTTLDTLDNWVDIRDLTLVYSGMVSVSNIESWVIIQLNNPFTYDNNSNLIVAFDENSAQVGSDGDEFYCSQDSKKGNVSIYFSSKETNPDPNSPPGGTPSFFYPNIRLQAPSAEGVPLSSLCVTILFMIIFLFLGCFILFRRKVERSSVH